MAKPPKSAPAEAEAPAKPKSKRLLLAAAGVLVLGLVGGAGWYFMKGSQHAEEPKAAVEELPTFVVLEPFTVNLQREESEQFLQIGITLKVSGMEMADKLHQRLPEIRSRLLFLLSSKRATELMPIEGKRKLAQDIIVECNTILGLRAAAPQNVAHESNAMPNAEATSGVEAAAAAPVEAAPAAHGGEAKKGVVDVLFTAFIIQ